MFPTFLVCLKIEKYQTIRCWLSCESTQVTKMFRWNSNVTRRTMNPSTVMLISWAFSPVDDSAAFLALVYLKVEISKKCKKNEENIIKNEKRKRKKIILLCHTIMFAALLWPYEQWSNQVMHTDNHNPHISLSRQEYKMFCDICHKSKNSSVSLYDRMPSHSFHNKNCARRIL